MLPSLSPGTHSFTQLYSASSPSRNLLHLAIMFTKTSLAVSMLAASSALAHFTLDYPVSVCASYNIIPPLKQ